MVFTLQQRILIIEVYFKTSSPDAVRVAFGTKYPTLNAPSNETIRKLVAKFRDTGSVTNRSKKRTRTVLNSECLDAISESIENDPQTSIRRMSQAVGISYGSTQTAMTKLLNLHPYKVSVVQELKLPDYGKRVNFCNWMLDVIENRPHVFESVFFSDEAYFHLSGYVNSQNYRTRSTENPHQFHQTPLYPQKIGVWCAISRTRIVGPIFFTQSLNSENYQEIIMQFIAQLEPSERYCWFQQDGAPCHTSGSTISFLSEFFDDRLISNPLWPPRSPDLSPLDFYLWGFLKSRVYSSNPTSIDQLKRNIEYEIELISSETLKKVSDNFKKRLQKCINSDGRHFEHLL